MVNTKAPKKVTSKGVATPGKAIKPKGAVNQLDSLVKSRTRAKQPLATQQAADLDAFANKKSRIQKAGLAQKVAKTSEKQSNLSSIQDVTENSTHKGVNNNATVSSAQAESQAEVPVVGSTKSLIESIKQRKRKILSPQKVVKEAPNIPVVEPGTSGIETRFSNPEQPTRKSVEQGHPQAYVHNSSRDGIEMRVDSSEDDYHDKPEEGEFAQNEEDFET